MGSDSQRFEQVESPRTPHTAPVDWNKNDNSWSQQHNAGNARRMVGNTIIIEGDIYGNGSKPATYGEAMSAMLNGDVRTNIAAIRPSDAQSYYANPKQVSDQYSWHQNGRNDDYRTAQCNIRFDPYSYYQNDRNSSVQPYRPIDMQPQSIPRPEMVKDRSGDHPQDNRPHVNQPRPHEASPCQPRQTYPCQPAEMHPYQQRHCRPHHGGWYPGKVAGHVLGRVFGRHCR